MTRVCRLMIDISFNQLHSAVIMIREKRSEYHHRLHDQCVKIYIIRIIDLMLERQCLELFDFKWRLPIEWCAYLRGISLVTPPCRTPHEVLTRLIRRLLSGHCCRYRFPHLASAAQVHSEEKLQTFFHYINVIPFAVRILQVHAIKLKFELRHTASNVIK